MKLIILDRDGVINHDSDLYIKSEDEWLPIPGSIEAIAKMTRAGYTVVVATNQSGIGRGFFSIDVLNAMHLKMQRLLDKHDSKIDSIFFCPHAPDALCDCRKPKPGLFHQISRYYNISLENTFAVGDSTRDLIAAETVGARPILVLTGKGTKTLIDLNDDNNRYPIFRDLDAFCSSLLKGEI